VQRSIEKVTHMPVNHPKLNASTTRPTFPVFHTISRKTGSRTDLAVREFLTYCPPGLALCYRIVALLGITDEDDLASLAEDGWFVL
jgi:hypothetical protein